MAAIRKTFCTTLHLASIRLLFWVSMATMDFVKAGATTSMTKGNHTAKPGCPSKCGNVTIPYPFGFGNQSCSLNSNYHVICDDSGNGSPRPLMRGHSSFQILEILDISETKLRIRNQVATECYNSSGGVTNNLADRGANFGFPSGSPFSFSADSNRLTAIGCSIEGVVLLSSTSSDVVGSTSCNSNCATKQQVVGGSCEGAGCCQAVIAQGAQRADVFLSANVNKNESLSYNRCAYAFLAEKGTFKFRGLQDFRDTGFEKKTSDHVPVVVDWVIGNETCKESQKQFKGSYACQANTACSNYPVNAIGGYTCSCLPGYQGNPYLSPGCADIDECAGLNNCSQICHNKPGKYSCSCPPGYEGDGMKNGTGCFKKRAQKLLFILKWALGISLGLFCLVLGKLVLCQLKQRFDNWKLKEEHFRNNGGFLLRELLSSPSLGDTEKLKIFTLDELKAATGNFLEDRVLGKGGHGVVYKAVLSNKQLVAVKKSKMVDQSQIEEFVNEMVILGQINHSNVVKIVGCCLESEVPMLVYEYISNGTLFEHIHSKKDERSWLDWSNCVRIAIEAASALAHLHSSVSIPIIHRDVKSSNILIDENYTAKIADFGASRLIPLDQTRLTTIVQGTLGYLDPEYYYSGHITEKSDVYSFGIVLIELLSRQKPISEEREITEAALATYFTKSVQAGNVLNILDPRIVEEAPFEQLSFVVDLISKCLNPKGEDRPTMMHVLIELKSMNIRATYPYVPQKQLYVVNSHHSQTPDEESDLYPSDLISRSSKALDEESDLYPVSSRTNPTTTADGQK